MAGETPRIGLGIDIGGSGIKGAPVDLRTGTFMAEREKIATPRPATPEAVATVAGEIVNTFSGYLAADSPVGAAFPGVVRQGVARSASNVAHSWVGTDVEQLLSSSTGCRVGAMNDADAAAVAEHRYGAAHGTSGLVLMTTLGTGLGTALLLDGALIPNTELGHLEIDGYDAETRAAASAKEREGLSYKQWATERLQRYYSTVENLLWPELIVVGGGVSREAQAFLPFLQLHTPIKAAQLRNTAGIIGAAIRAAERCAN